MSNEVAVQSNTNVALPANLAALFGQSGITTDVAKEKVNSLRYPGKVWQLTVDGQTTEITMTVSGERVPAQIVDVILLNIGNPRQRNRAVFDAYEEGSTKGPLCHSDDGVAPSADVLTPFATNCKQCPKAEKGSGKPDDQGNPTVACKWGKIICVVPSTKPDFKALELRMKVTSLWQPPENAVVDEKDGWRSLDSHIKYLEGHKVPYMSVVTSMKFASTDNYPRILFKSEMVDENGMNLVGKFKFLEPAIAAVSFPRFGSDEVLKILGTHKKDEDGSEPVKQLEAPKPTPPAPKAAEPIAEAPEVVEQPVAEAPVVAEQPAIPKVEKPKAAKKPPVQVIEEGELMNLSWE